MTRLVSFVVGYLAGLLTAALVVVGFLGLMSRGVGDE